MRLKKQSMREVADAGMVQRYASMVDGLVKADPLDRPVENKPRYFRGALVKPKPETKSNGDKS
jgi:hypothetical protein